MLIERRYPPFGWALPGGLVEENETAEAAVRREVREEVGLELDNLKLFGVYSEPGRDERFDCISIVYTAVGRGQLRVGDDAGSVKAVPLTELRNFRLAFDHSRILADYVAAVGSGLSPGHSG